MLLKTQVWFALLDIRDIATMILDYTVIHKQGNPLKIVLAYHKDIQ